MYAMVTTWLDIAYACSSVAQFTQNPDPEHWKALDRIFCYLYHTIDHSVTFGNVAQDELDLVGYTDANWGEDTTTRRSTGAYIFTLNGGPVSWSAKRQATVALSSTEAEYIALCQACREAVSLRELLTELGYHKRATTIRIHVDNQGAIALGKNANFHKRTKHVDIQYHYVRECVSNKWITTPFLPTKLMLADGLTKPLSPERHQYLIDRCRLSPHHQSTGRRRNGSPARKEGIEGSD